VPPPPPLCLPAGTVAVPIPPPQQASHARPPL
jgi:hypothetical protein